MGTVDAAGAVLAAGVGVAAAALAGAVVPAVVAVATAVVVTATCCVRLGCRGHAVLAGFVGYAGLGVVALLAAVPPDYDAAVGAAILASGLFGLASVEAGTRAGVVLAGRRSGGPDYGGVWLLPAAGIAATAALWRLGAVGRAVVGGVVLALLGAHVGVLALGGAPVPQASTLLPVALLCFLVFPLVDTASYLSREPEGSPLRRVGGAIRGVRGVRADDGGASAADQPSPTRSPGQPSTADTSTVDAPGVDTPTTDATADDAPAGTTANGSAPAAGGGSAAAVKDSPSSPASDGSTATAEDEPSAAATSPGGSSPADSGGDSPSEPSGGRGGASARGVDPTAGTDASETVATAGPDRPSDWVWVGRDDARTGRDGADRSDGTGVEPTADAEAGVEDERPACQNCGNEGEDRAARFVVTEPASTVVLCPDCQDRRADGLRSRADCRGSEIRGAIGDATACAACGDADGSLEAHPIVPLAAGGHRHPNNVLALCPSCHAAVEDHRVADGARGASRQP